jgi:membrane-associated phospholipid phosphatase
MLQHTDTKAEQQRLLCLDEKEPTAPLTCVHPFVMLNDLGLTFGRAHLANQNLIGSVNLEEWSKTPIWKHPTGCVGNLPKSFTGTLKDPLISEEGRQFLASLLSKLSDKQLHDLFSVARVDLRPRSPIDPDTAPASVGEWVRVFKEKRAEIAGRRCTEPWSATAPLLFKTGPNVWLQTHSSRALTKTMNWVSFLGFNAIYTAFVVMLIFGYRLRAGIALLALLALNAVMVDAAKIVVSYPRPDSVDSRVESLDNDTLSDLARIFDAEESAVSVDADDGYGFPSGHVASATALAFGLVFLFGWRWAWLLMFTWMPFVAVSRMYLGRHFLGDVVGGFAVGVIAVATAFVGLTLARLRDPESAPRAARHLLLTAVGLTVFALWIRLPGAYDAGRFLGVAVAVFLIIQSAVPDEASWPIRAGRLIVAMLIFFATAWATALVLEMVGKTHEPVGALLAGALPTAMFLIGPIYLPRTLTFTRKSPLLSPR